MVRSIILSLAVLLTALAAPAFAQTSINVQGSLSNGSNVAAVCSIKNGQVSGTGVLYGINPANGYTFRYPFAITSLSTAKGQVILGGNIVGTNIPVTLSATVPNGPLSFAYVVNGTTYTLTGMGTVTVK